MNKEVTILRTSRKGIEIEVIENEVSGVKWKIDTTKHDKQIRNDAIEEVCKQISERVEYWEQCANAVEKESNEYKIFVSLQKNFSDLAEQMQKGEEE